MRNALVRRTTDVLKNRRELLTSENKDRGGLSLEWLLVAGFLVVAAGVVALAYGGRIQALIATLGT